MCSKWSDEALSLQDLSHIFTSCVSRLTSWCCLGVTKLCWPLLKANWNCSLSTAPKLSSRDGLEVRWLSTVLPELQFSSPLWPLCSDVLAGVRLSGLKFDFTEKN